MKKIILSLAFVSCLATISNAQTQTATSATPVKQQNNQTPEERSQHSAKWAEKNLGLNADQKSQWQVAALKRAMANQPLHEQMKTAATPADKKTIHAQIKTNDDAFESSIATFITPDQKAKYDQIKAQKREAHKSNVKSGKLPADAVEEDVDK